MTIKESRLSESVEMYLKTIYTVMRDKGAARSKDISAILEVSSSAVTGALRTLKKDGFINYAPYDVITLTPNGEKVATEILQRYESLCHFFKDILNLEDAEASKNACRLEHVVSDPVLDRLVDFSDFLKDCPRTGQDILAVYRDRAKCDMAEECAEVPLDQPAPCQTEAGIDEDAKVIVET